MASFFVVTNNDLSEYKKEKAVALQPILRDKFLVPELATYHDPSNRFEFFSPLSTNRDHL